MYYGDEAPDDEPLALFGVIGSVTNRDGDLTATCVNTVATIQVALHARGVKYKNRIALNQMAGRLFAAVYPTTNSGLDMEPYGMQMKYIKLIQDVQQDQGKLGGYDHRSRILIFEHGIFLR